MTRPLALPPVSPVLLSPHTAGSTEPAAGQILRQTSANLRPVLAGQAPVDPVNGVTGVGA